MRKTIVLLFLSIIFISLHSQTTDKNDQRKRNVIFILVDDQRYDFLSYLDHPWIKTPHIDALAEHSLYFNNAFVTTSLCSPSRASILTGLYTHDHQVLDNATPLPPDLPTFPKVLQQAGYHTAFIGKWHMGGNNDAPRPGFDHWVSFKGQGRYFDPALNVDGKQVSHRGYTPDILTDYATAFIQSRKGNDQPYFLYLSHKSIHEDFSPAPRHKGTYKDLEIPRPASFADTDQNYEGKPLWLKRQRKSWHGAERDYSIQNYGDYETFFRKYSECMLAVDESIGRISQSLEEMGALEETVIIYFSDNGYMMGEHGLIDKRVMYEPSIRVPSFVHCPDLIPESRIEEKFILNVDFAPTIIDLAGAEIPSNMKGASFVPIIYQRENTKWRDAFVYEYFIDPYTPHTPTIFGLRTEDYSYMTYHGVWDLFELYDMKKDPAQRHNLIGKVKMGHSYGTFTQQVSRQIPDIFPLVETLEKRLDEELGLIGGSRIPNWKAAKPK